MFGNLLKQNLRGSRVNLSKALVNVVFFLLITFSLLFFLQDEVQLSSKNIMIRTVIWFSLLFSVFYQTVDFLKEDYHDGTIQQMIVMFWNIESYILVKITSFWLGFCLPIVITSAIVMNIFGFSGEQIVMDVFLLIFSSIAISFISCLCASFNIISRRATLLVILALPIILPVVMVAIIGNIKILIALSIFLSIISLFSCAKIVKIVSD